MFGSQENQDGLTRVAVAGKPRCCKQPWAGAEKTEESGKGKGCPSGQLVTTCLSQKITRSTLVDQVQPESMENHDKKERLMLHVLKHTYKCVITVLVVIQRVKIGYFSE